MKDINEGRILDATRLTELVQRQQMLIEEQRAELEALRTELSTLTSQADTVVTLAVTQKNFIATGPGTGFLTLANTNDGMDRGVVGIGSKEGSDQIAQTIGVLGYTALLGSSTISNGKGVVGLTFGGTGVERHDIGGGTGISGISDGDGIGVSGAGVIGIFGFGYRIGVDGSGDLVGVLGGAAVGRFFQPGAGRVSTGVMGTGVLDPEGLDYDYGGWFDALSGTAPLHLEPSQNPLPPLAAQKGDLFVSSDGFLYFCTNTGDNNPNKATWRKVQLV